MQVFAGLCNLFTSKITILLKNGCKLTNNRSKMLQLYNYLVYLHAS